MSRNRRIVLSLIIAILLVSFAIPEPVLAWSSCGSTYIVQRGDTLSGIAMLCGTTVSALRLANPGLGQYIYAGQRLVIPGGDPGSTTGWSGTGTYVVMRGDTLRKIADRMGLCVSDLIAANPQLWNPNLIYPGQVIYLPAANSHYCWGYSYNTWDPPTMYTVRWGDTLRIIAARYGTTVDHLMALNPTIWNRNWIYAGQVIRVR